MTEFAALHIASSVSLSDAWHHQAGGAIGAMLLSASMVFGSPEAADAVTESQLIFLEVRQLLLSGSETSWAICFPRAAADDEANL